MGKNDFALSDIIIRRDNIKDYSQFKIPAVFLLIVCLILIAYSLYISIKEGTQYLIDIAVILAFLLIGVNSAINLLGRSYGISKLQPKNMRAWVVEYENKIIAWAFIRHQENYSILEKLDVENNFERKGVGSSLIR